MPPSDFAKANVDQVLESLTTDEAILLTAGVGFWYTHAVERLGVPAIKVSDGPNGIRGNHFFMGTPAKCLPSATALGATWDTELIKEVGLKLLAEEAKFRAASLILAPTCNIQRSFESFSEDPFLSGIIAAAYVNGVQSGGIGTTIKHFVANDKENDRNAYDSILSQRALREIYLMPFMLAQKYAQPWAYMTAYNRVNGPHWFGVYSVDHSLNAGLDLEMPGLNKLRTLDLVNRSIRARKVTVRTIKQRAKPVLELVQKCAKGAPEILDGDVYCLLRKVAAESIVLLRNEGSLLPLKPKELKKVAIIGGSAALKPSFFVTPHDGIVKALKESGSDIEVTYSEGARASLDYDMLTATGERGWIASWHKHLDDDSLIPVEEAMEEGLVDETRIFISTSSPKGITRRWTMKLRGQLKLESKILYVDGNLVIDNWTRQVRGEDFFGLASIEEKGTYPLKAGQKHDILVEFCNVRGPADGDADETVMDSNPGVRLGGAVVEDSDQLLGSAVQLAKDADVAIIVVGLNSDWETEGYDRTTLALPGRTDELISKVVAANPKTVVVTQSGSSILMPWADSVPAIVHSWYLGNATGDAIADVLFGKHNPSGKLSLTFPKRVEDVPSFGHFHSEDGKIRFQGYKHYQHRNLAPLFSFGHGLSYTTFNLSDLQISQPVVADGEFDLNVSLTVTNTGQVAGSEIVQVYVSLPTTSDLTHPLLQLKGFTKVRDLAPGASDEVQVKLDKYAVSYWSELYDTWSVEKGVYGVKVGTASDHLDLEGTFEIVQGFEWRGL
ncbi:glycoside hydrolase family 3 protein [Gymnopilus junonius]|uniref:beta-glucosidase n=1 Tax=Gymnopilus junonius TaxID=109634 RepID=A0A9P5NL62_GYMJU|nr:glycoside hydrolase family 3 protein [Gymnopilus junonius]